MTITAITARLDGFAGGPGFNTWYYRKDDGANMSTAEVNGALGDVRAFYDAIKANFPTTMGIQVLSPARLIDETDGDLLGMDGTVVPALVSGTTVAALGPAQVALLCRFNTGTVVDRRVLQGRLYLGPLQNGVTSAGTVPAPATLAGINAALVALLAATTSVRRLAVWHRPRPASAAHPVAREGAARNVIAAVAPSRWVTQRRRLPE